MEQTTARLRKTFQHKSDSDSDSLPEALDEDEQETLISTLHTQNESHNTQYTYLFLSLPLVSCVLYLPSLFTPTSSKITVPALLAITSLLSSAYILYSLPAGKCGIRVVDSYFATTTAAQVAAPDGRLPRLGERMERGPVELYLPYLNLLLCGLCSILGLLVGVQGGAWFGFGWLPGMVFAVICMVKVVMGSVDVGELEGLRYGYKGA